MPTSTTHTVVSKRLTRSASLLVALVFALTPARAPAQTTAFTYQGQLTEAGTGANGNYDLQCALFDIAAGGTQIGTTQTVPTVPVSNGLFTVQLDFGVNAFPGANRFLEIGVRPVGGGSFTTLAPRQQISSTPYAIRTLSAATADALSSTCTGCVQDTQIQSVAGSKVTGTIPVASVPAGSGNYIQNRTTEQPSATFNISGNGRVGGNLTVDGTLNANIGGNFIQNRTTQQSNANFNISGNGTAAGILSAGSVGIGTTSPEAKLHVNGAAEGVRIQGTAAGVSNEAYATFYNAAGTRIGYVGDGSTGDNTVFLDADLGDVTLNTAAGRVLTATSTGNVGIGTTAPTAKLSVIATGDGARVLHLGTERAWVFKQLGTGAATALELTGDNPNNNNKNFLIQTDGLVGIGTLSPTAKLDVRGDVKLGGSGQFFAPGGDENLRIVRGVISAAGQKLEGSGFTAAHGVGVGLYRVNFNPAFAGTPTVVATVDNSGSSSNTKYVVNHNASSATFVQFLVRDPEGEDRSDQIVDFIAVGPR